MVTNKDTVLQQASYGFDTFAEEVYPTLLKGAKLVIPDKNDVKDITALSEYILVHDVTIIDCSPLMLNELNQVLQKNSIHTYISGGDILSIEQTSTGGQTPIIDDYGTIHESGQTFIPTSDISLNKITVQLTKNGVLNTGTLALAIYNTVSGLPTGSALGTSSPINISDISTGDWDFNFTTPVSLTASTQYAFITITAGVTDHDITDFLNLNTSTSDIYSNGTVILDDTIISPVDLYFKIYAAGSSQIKVKPGNGIELNDNGVSVDLGQGLVFDGSDQVAVDLGLGLEFDGSDQVQVNAYYGITVDANGVSVDAADDSLLVNNNGVSVVVGDGLELNGNGVSVTTGDGIDFI